MQRNASTADGTSFQIPIGLGPVPSLYRNICSLQHQNAVWYDFGKSVRNSEQNPPDEPWEDAACAQGLLCVEQSPCHRHSLPWRSFG